MSYTIELPTTIKNELILHAQNDLPNECCGYITGSDGICKTLHKMTNVDASPTYFEFDPKEQFHVVKTARQNGEQPIVVYHSHPESPARLSQKDLELLTDPNMVYLIISLEKTDPDIRAYRIVDHHIYDVEIVESR